ncbi:MAG: hypothetical protein ACTSUB_07765 [Candidatus Thorarchaeota archaeon]
MDAIETSRLELRKANESGDSYTIALARFQLGLDLLGSEKIADAEEQWQTVLTEHLNSEDAKMRVLIGEILLVRAYILRGKSLYNQAIEVALEADAYLGKDDHAGHASANQLLAELYQAQGDTEKSDMSRELSESYQAKIKSDEM